MVAHYFWAFVLDEWEARSYAIIPSLTLILLQIQITLTNVHWLWWCQDANKVRGTMYGHSSHTYIWVVYGKACSEGPTLKKHHVLQWDWDLTYVLKI